MPTEKKFNKRLVAILKTFDKKTLKQFEFFLQTPFINQKVHQPAIQLFSILKRQHPNYKDLSPSLLFKQMKVTSSYKAGTFRNWASQLYRAAKEFIAFLEFKQHPHLALDFLLEALFQRRLPNIIKLEYNEGQRNLNKQTHKDINQLYAQFLLRHRANQYTTMFNARNPNTILSQLMQDLDIYYIASKLKYFVIALTWQRIIKTNHSFHFFEEILQMVAQNETIRQIPIINLYYHLTLALKNYHSNTDHFKKTQQLLVEHGTKFPKYEARQLYTIALNYCRWKTTDGEIQFAKEAVVLYNTILDHEILYAAQHIRPEHFWNMVKVGTQSYDLEWTRHIIKNYSSKIPLEHQKNIVNYSHAALAFAERHYSEAYQYLAAIYIQNEFLDFYYYIDYKILLIQTLYELAELDKALNEVDTLRVYFTRNQKTPTSASKVYQNFIKVIRKLINRKTKTGYVKFLKTKMPVKEKNWLMQKAQTLDGTRRW